MKNKIVLILIVISSLALPSAYSQADMTLLNRGEKVLREIEPKFAGTPVYLIDDDQFKAKLKDSLMAAIDLIEKAHQENPAEVKALYLLGKAYSFGHDLNMPGAWQKSTRYLEEYLESEKGNYKAYLYLAKNYMDAERFVEAYDIYKIAHGLEPNSEAEKFMAVALMFQNKTPEAIAALKRYVLTHPKDQDAPKMLQALEEGRFSKEVTSAK